MRQESGIQYYLQNEAIDNNYTLNINYVMKL